MIKVYTLNRGILILFPFPSSNSLSLHFSSVCSHNLLISCNMKQGIFMYLIFGSYTSCDSCSYFIPSSALKLRRKCCYSNHNVPYEYAYYLHAISRENSPSAFVAKRQTLVLSLMISLIFL